MQCYYCGTHTPHGVRTCPACGRAKSRLSYVHLCGVVGGIVGSLVGFTGFGVAGALGGGFIGIVGAELVAWMIFRSRRTKPDIFH